MYILIQIFSYTKMNTCSLPLESFQPLKSEKGKFINVPNDGRVHRVQQRPKEEVFAFTCVGWEKHQLRHDELSR